MLAHEKQVLAHEKQELEGSRAENRALTRQISNLGHQVAPPSLLATLHAALLLTFCHLISFSLRIFGRVWAGLELGSFPLPLAHYDSILGHH